MRITILNILLLLSTLAFGQDNHSAITQFTTNVALKHASIGISVVDLDSHKTSVAHNSQLALVPASLTKIITTASALEILGPEYAIPTKLGYSGQLTNNSLNGDIIITGYGDPTIESKYFKNRQGITEQWIKAIKEANIRLIQGSIIMRAENFSTESVSSRWVWEDLGNYYGSGVYPFSIKDNTYKIAFKSGKAGSKVEIIERSEEANKLQFYSDVTAANNNKDSAYIYGSPIDNMRYIHGTIPQNRNRFVIKGSIANPAQALGESLKSKLIEAGIRVIGQVKVEYQFNGDITAIKTFYSPTIKELIKPTNHKSINLFADHLFWQIPQNYGHKANVGNAFKDLNSFWKEKGIETDALQLWDGSGLSPQNTVSPAFLTDMLLWFQKHSYHKDALINSLPIAGKTGSVKRVLDNTKLEGQVYMKSGSMDRVRCYAGYVMKNGSPKYAFAIMVNHFTADSKDVIKAIEQLMLDLF